MARHLFFTWMSQTNRAVAFAFNLPSAARAMVAAAMLLSAAFSHVGADSTNEGVL